MRHRLSQMAALCAVLFLALIPLPRTSPAEAQAPLQGRWKTFANGDEVRAVVVQEIPNLVWAGTHNGGVVRWDPADGSYKQFLAPQDGIAGNDVRAIATNNYDFVWFATNRGLSQLETVEPYRWTTYTMADGLPSDDVTAVALAPDNRLWVGTSQYWDAENNAWTGGGVAIRFGGEWIVYDVDDGLPSNNITGIAFQGTRVWVATRPYKVYMEPPDVLNAGWYDSGGGVALLENGVWKAFTKENSGLPNNYVNAVAAGPDGRVWFATPGGLASYDGQNWRVYTKADGLSETKIRDVYVDDQGRVWVVTYKSEDTPIGALEVLEGDAWHRYTVEDGLSSQVLRAVYVDGQDRVWIGTEPWCKETSGCKGGGLTEFHPIDNTWKVYRTWEKGNLVSNRVTALALAPDGSLWVGTRGSGVSVYRNGTWTHYTKENSPLASNLVRAIAVDPTDGSIWIGTAEYVENGQYVGGGINHFKDGQWVALYTTANSDLPRNAITALAVNADGLVWIGVGNYRDSSGSGLAVFDPALNHWELYDVERGMPSNLVTGMAFDIPNDRVWVVTAPYSYGNPTGGGVVKFEHGQLTTTYTAENSEIPTWSGSDVTGDFRVVAVDGNGTPWVGTYTTPYNLVEAWPYVDATIAHLENGGWVADTFPEQGYISALAFDPDGRLWAGISHVSLDGGHKELAGVDHATRGGLRVRFGTTWAEATEANSPLASNDIQALVIAPNEGDVWIGTYDAGISQLEGAYAGQAPTPTPTVTPTATVGPTETLGPGPTPSRTPPPYTPTPGTPSPPPPEVPEAATLILMGSGLAGLGGYAAYWLRKRRNENSGAAE